MQIRFRPQARQEALDAADWYRQRLPGLDREFLLAVDVAVKSAAARPLSFPAVEGTLRRVLVKRFPYSIIFDVLDDQPVAWRLRR